MIVKTDIHVRPDERSRTYTWHMPDLPSRHAPEVLSLAACLPGLRANFPGYAFTVAYTHHGVSFVATRIRDGSGPLLVITADVDELQMYLTCE